MATLMQQPLYTSAPILDYDYDDEPQPLTDEAMLESVGVMSLETEAFDAAILEALVAP
jgi:hypothetical protein